MTRKTNKGRRAIAAAQDNLQVGPIVHQAADRIGPLAQDAAERIGPLAHDAADRIGPLAHDAADRVGPLAHQAADRIAPLAQDAAERIAPLAQAATERIQPYAKQAADWIEPRAQDAAERLAPYAETARKKGAHAAAQAVDRLGPRLDDAAGRIGPAVDEARERLQSDVLPRISEKLGEIAGSDAAPAAVVAVAEKGKELLPAGKKKRRWPKALAVVAGVLTAGGVAYYAAKKFFGNTAEPEWQTTRPTTPYAATTITEPKASTGEPTVTESPAATPATPAEAVAASASTAPSPDEVAPAHAAEESGEAEAPSGDGSKYGDGAYVGSEPPEGFTIKGNERSKKYHVTGTEGYERTNADVWFNSESAAETAGFTKAQR